MVELSANLSETIPEFTDALLQIISTKTMNVRAMGVGDEVVKWVTTLITDQAEVSGPATRWFRAIVVDVVVAPRGDASDFFPRKIDHGSNRKSPDP
jgi:hypothetical protein